MKEEIALLLMFGVVGAGAYSAFYHKDNFVRKDAQEAAKEMKLEESCAAENEMETSDAYEVRRKQENSQLYSDERRRMQEHYAAERVKIKQIYASGWSTNGAEERSMQELYNAEARAINHLYSAECRTNGTYCTIS